MLPENVVVRQLQRADQIRTGQAGNILPRGLQEMGQYAETGSARKENLVPGKLRQGTRC
jgi:hypothetical protein